MAELADPHELYEASVQSVEEECEFVSDKYREIRGREALTFREDFCGTASAACQWVRQGPEHTAIGVDIDPKVLNWGRKNQRRSSLLPCGRSTIRARPNTVFFCSCRAGSVRWTRSNTSLS